MKLNKLHSVFSALVLAATAKAEILLTIDIANPAAVTISATGGLASNSVSTSAADGIYLNEFFTSVNANFYFPEGISGSLAPATPSSQVTGNTVLSIQLDTRALNYYRFNDLAHNWSFTTGELAFTGVTSAFNFTSTPSYLPSAGTSGNIAVNDIIIGQWQAVAGASVPEPASFGLIAGLVLGGFAFTRRSRKGQTTLASA